MDQSLSAAKSCPECGSTDYVFRSRKKVPANPEKGEGEAFETKSRCKACNHEWWVRTPVTGKGQAASY